MLAAACLFLAIVLVMQTIGGNTSAASADIIPSDLKAKIAEEQLLLDRPIRDVRFDSLPLWQAIDILAARAGVNISVNWKSIEGAGIDRNAPVTLHLTRPTFRQALQAVSKDVSSSADPLEFMVQDNIVFFSTMDDLARVNVTEIYDIQDLIDRLLVAENTRSTRQWTREDAVETISRVIYDSVDDNWRHSGAIRELHGRLIITQTQKNQQAVAAALERLSAADLDEKAVGGP
jgi:hypothetical protein